MALCCEVGLCFVRTAPRGDVAFRYECFRAPPSATSHVAYPITRPIECSHLAAALRSAHRTFRSPTSSPAAAFRTPRVSLQVRVTIFVACTSLPADHRLLSHARSSISV